ncbi:MAG: MerR family transcriptional regulator [Ferruginibacter sp.]
MFDKQSSLFDFDEPSLKAEAESILPTVSQEENLPLVNTIPVEIDFLPSRESIVVGELPRTSKRGRPKLSEAYLTADLIEVPDDDILFQKKYYSIGKVADMFKVNISLIRFWEKEFDILKPRLNGKGDRHFRPEDVKNLKLIHHLLREKKYTIEGANDFLKKNKKSDEVFSVIEELQRTKTFLLDLKLSL